MSVDGDPLASLRCWPVAVLLAGREYLIPALPAADWFAAILGDAVLPGMLPDADQDALSDLLLARELTADELIEAARDAIEVASGWRWWVAQRMVLSAGAEWVGVSGALFRRGIDLRTLPLGAVLNALYALATEGLDKTKRVKFDLDLNAPPPMGAVDEDLREQMAADAFAAAIGGAVPG